MGQASERPTVEVMLAHREWVRRLARALVADAHEAADVEQETWFQALARPPADAGNLRQWLGKRARDESTRRAHERGEGRGSGEPWAAPIEAAAHDVTERAELHRRVVEELLNLDALYRVPLLLRYFDDLPAPEVARRLNVPVETARTRIKRGLQQLKDRLAVQFGSGDRHWTVVLMPLIHGPRGSVAPAASAAVTAAGSSAALPLKGAVMSKAVKLTVAAAVGIAAVASYRAWVEPTPAVVSQASSPSSEMDAGPSVMPPPEEAADAAELDRTRELIEPRTTIEPRAASAGRILGTVVDRTGRPVPRATVVLEPNKGQPMSSIGRFREVIRSRLTKDPASGTWRVATTDEKGAFEFDRVAVTQPWEVGAFHDPLGIGWTDNVSFVDSVASPLVQLEPGIVIFGTVRDPAGRAIESASVSLGGALEEREERPFWMAELRDRCVTTPEGKYRSLPLPWKHLKIHVYVHQRPDLAQSDGAWEELPTGVTEIRRDVTVPGETVLQGRILSSDGEPARLMETVVPLMGADAWRTQSREAIAVIAFNADPREDPGRVERLSRNEPGLTFMSSDHEYGVLDFEQDRYEIALHQPELHYVALVARNKILGVAEIPRPLSETDIWIDVDLVPGESLIHGLLLHFRDGRDQTPLEGVRVHGTIQSLLRGQLSQSVLHFGSLANPQELPADRELELPLYPCNLMMAREGYASRTIWIDPSRDDAPTELWVDFLPTAGPITVHVRDPDGEPVAKATVRAYRGTDLETVWMGSLATTDDQGEALLSALPGGELVLVAETQGLAPAVARVERNGDESSYVTLEMETGFEVVVHAHFPDGTPTRRGSVVVRDAEGVPIYDDLQPDRGAGVLRNRRLHLTHGTYEVRCVVPAQYEGSTTFVAAEGARIDVELLPTGRSRDS